MHERDRMKCKNCRLYSDCGISLRTSGETLCVEPSVVSDEETTEATCANCTHDEVCRYRNTVSAEECVFFSDDAEAKADYNNENEDNNFFCHIISEICNYAVSHGMKPDETMKEIAKNMLAMLKISTFNAWTISEQAESEEKK